MSLSGLEEQDEPLPPDQWLKCGRCKAAFFSVVHRSRPTFVCLFCEHCEAIIAEENLGRHERWRQVKAAKKAAKKAARKRSKKDMAAVVDALIGSKTVVYRG